MMRSLLLAGETKGQPEPSEPRTSVEVIKLTVDLLHGDQMDGNVVVAAMPGDVSGNGDGIYSPAMLPRLACLLWMVRHGSCYAILRYV